ncbi:hypothetical protein PGTUg99_023631 [Puccinia graminis f. sp. tritici]|uniref:Uncharacterized protein n=1 Tax=Puccinia graminis f. sp. tritici TaxID=56615 RepID=A0A5B0S7B0_PUCGR|nr:hypothetical protein PGTUg99_023631 [Puccinia graminis f. sp. tritici]
MASNSQTSPTWIIPVQEQREPPWAMDLVNGGPKSLAILLDWLSTGDNYTQWVTTGVRDPKREDVCLDVVARMQQHGIRHRTAMGRFSFSDGHSTPRKILWTMQGADLMAKTQ